LPQGSTGTAGSVTVGGVSGTQTLAIDRATLTISSASVINANGHLDFLVAQSVLTGAGNLMVNGTLNWTNGTMSGTGTTTIGGGGVLAIESGGVTLGRTLNNGGTGTWSGGNLTLSAGVVFNNLAGGTFDITADGHVMGSATTPINNSGLFRQAAGTAGTIVTAPFNNSGTLDVLAATLNLNLGGTHTSTMSNALGATLNFGGGSHVLASGSFVTGAGVLSMSGNATTLTASGAFDTGSTLSVTAGTATLASTCNLTGAILNISGANSVVNFNSSGSVAVVNLTGGTLGGTSPITVTGLLTLGGGTITSSLVTANGGLNINGGVTLNGGRLVNPKLAIWSAGNFIGANGAVFSNLLGATFINTFDGNAMSGTGATPIFVNAGVFAKTNGTAASGATSIDFQFINTGTVEVQTNTLRYSINQQTAGLTLLDGGGLSAQTPQPLQFLGGSLVGTGLVTVANTVNVINSAAISPGFPLGELDISGNYQQTASGALNIELGGNLPGTNFDLVTVTGGGAGGVATLGGTLNVTLTNGFSPAKGAAFTFLTALSRVGAFATFNYPSNDIGMQVSYDATSAKVTVSNLKPVVANPISNPAPVVYGAAFNFQFPANTFSDPDGDPLTYNASGMPPGITFAGATRTFSGTPTQAGVFSVTVAANDGGTPSLTATNTFTITVNPATLTIAVQPKSKLYGAADPALTFTVSGLQFSDTPATALAGALARAAGETVAGSPYAITQGTLAANANYTINFTGSTLAITPVALSITADAKTKTYGAADPVFTVTYTGFVNGETTAVLGGTLAFTRVPGENVGSYLITPSGLTSGNYTIAFNTGTLTITKAALSITADAKTKIFGAADPAFTATYTGFVNGETPAVLGGTLAFTRAPGQNIGSYLITPSGQTSGNYVITFNTGTLTITAPAPLMFPLALLGKTNVVISWSAVSNGTYRVQYQPVLNATNWTDLIGDVTATGSTASKTDSLTTTNRFYRVRVQP
jgi:MBG domain (YGX type)